MAQDAKVVLEYRPVIESVQLYKTDAQTRRKEAENRSIRIKLLLEGLSCLGFDPNVEQEQRQNLDSNSTDFVR